jgi:hypothetical protein
VIAAVSLYENYKTQDKLAAALLFSYEIIRECVIAATLCHYMRSQIIEVVLLTWHLNVCNTSLQYPLTDVCLSFYTYLRSFCSFA